LDRRSTLAQYFYAQLRRLFFLPSSHPYNLTVCHEKAFLWFRVAKVGTRTIFKHFEQNGLKLDAEHPMSVYYPVTAYDDYFKFAFVRNPWDRIVSCWHNKVLGMNYFRFSEAELTEMQHFSSFVAWVGRLNIETCDPHLRLQCRLIDLNHIDFIGRLEHFSTDLATIFRRLGIPYVEKIRKNVSTQRGQYQEYYTDELIDIVTKIYSKDIQIFNYDF
jgi:hypothetical protein